MSLDKLDGPLVDSPGKGERPPGNRGPGGEERPLCGVIALHKAGDLAA